MYKSRKKSSRSSSSRSASRHTTDEAGIMNMFNELADEEDPTIITIEGISKLGENIGIDPFEDVRCLVLLWKFGVEEKPGQVSKDEWVKGCQTLGVDSYDKIKSLLPSFDLGFLVEEFRAFYKFCFQFNRQGTHKTLDKELVVELLPLVVQDRIGKERVTTFCKFLSQSEDIAYKNTTLDQWMSFYDFSMENPDDLSGYDEDESAWPCMIDDYVDFMEQMQE